MGFVSRALLAGILVLALAGMTAGHRIALALATVTTTALDATPAPAVTGQTVQLKATVDCGGTAPTGTVSFFEGTTLLGQGNVGAGGVATINHAFNAGSHPLQAIYAGDTNCAGSPSNQITENVITAGTNTTHTSSPNPATAGQPVTLTATVTVKSPGSGTPTGTVSFFDQSNSGQNLGTATLGANGNAANQASLQISTLSVGQHNINAQYNGDNNFSQSASTPATQTVNAGGGAPGLPAASTQLTSAPNPSTAGQQVTFTATVTCSGGTPSGTVSFREYPQGSTTPTLLATRSLAPVAGSNPPRATATYQTSTLAVGTHTITAVYSGDNVTCSGGPESTPVQQVVNARPTSAGAQAPSESCSPAGNIPVGTSTTCTLTTQSDVPSGGTIVKQGYVIDSSSQLNLTTLACGAILAGGFNCSQTNQDILTFTCTPPQGQTACLSGSQFQALVTSQSPGELGEGVLVTPPDNGQPQEFSIAPRDAAVIWVSRGFSTGSSPFFAPGVNEFPTTPATQPANNPQPTQSQPANPNAAAIASLRAQIATLLQQQTAADADFGQQLEDNTARMVQWSDFGTASLAQYNADLDAFQRAQADVSDSLVFPFAAVQTADTMVIHLTEQSQGDYQRSRDTLQQIIQLEIDRSSDKPQFVDRVTADLQTLVGNGDDMYQLVANIIQADQAYQILLSIRQSIQANQQSTDTGFLQQIAALQSQISALGG